MKRIFALALMALLLCLPVWAMAEGIEWLHVNDRMEFSTKALLDARDEEGMVYIMVDRPDSTIVLNNVVLPDTNIYIESEERDSSVRIELIGDNSISTEANEGIALQCDMPLTITGEGSLTCTSRSYIAIGAVDLTLQSGKLTAEGGWGGMVFDYIPSYFSFLGDELTVKGTYFGIGYAPDDEPTYSFTLPEYSSAPAGYTFKAWSVTKGENSPEMLQPGDSVDTFGSDRVSVKPVFEKIPELPKTGDGSNLLLWSALVCMSALCMTTLLRKKKNA